MKKMMIFDMDGVIIDSEPIHEVARRELFQRYGVKDGESLPNPIGKSCSGYWKEVLQMQNLSGDPLQMQEEQYARVAEIVRRDRIPANEGMIELLKWCRAHHISIGLASSSTRMLVDRILEYLALKEYFDVTVSGDEVDRKKPDPEIYRKVLELGRVSAADAVAVEDSASGIKAARGAGIFCCGYVNPTSGVQNLSEADHVISKLLQLKAVLSELTF